MSVLATRCEQTSALSGRAWAAGLAVCLLLGAGCARKEAATPPPAPKDSDIEIAKKAAVLYENAKDRCLGLARRAMTKRETFSDGKTRITAGEFFATGAQPELAVIASFAFQAFEHTNRIRGALDRPLVDALYELRRIQRLLCDGVNRNWVEAERYEARVGENVSKFNGIWKTVDRHLLITDADRSRILAQFATQAEEAMAHVRDRVSAQDSGTNWLEKGGTEEDPEVIAARLRASREEENWRQRQAAQRDALHRKAIEEWRSGAATDGPGAMPSLGIERVDRSKTESPAQQLARWHRGFLERSAGTRVALERYRMVREQRNDAQHQAACRAVFGATSDLLEDGRVFGSPRSDVGTSLRKAQESLRRMAEACLAGNRKAEAGLLAEVDRHLDAAQTILEAEGVSPRP